MEKMNNNKIENADYAIQVLIEAVDKIANLNYDSGITKEQKIEALAAITQSILDLEAIGNALADSIELDFGKDFVSKIA